VYWWPTAEDHLFSQLASVTIGMTMDDDLPSEARGTDALGVVPVSIPEGEGGVKHDTAGAEDEAPL
jgi:hypothetical protein